MKEFKQASEKQIESKLGDRRPTTPTFGGGKGRSPISDDKNATLSGIRAKSAKLAENGNWGYREISLMKDRRKARRSPKIAIRKCLRV